MSNTSKYYQNCRKEMMSFLPKHYSRILEIGCAEGNFRENLSKEHEYWGIEPNVSAAVIASKKLDKILIGTFQEIYNQIPNNYFDLVICNDVIEHMVDHDEFFLSIKKKIQKDGYLVMSIPNVRYLLNISEILVKKDWEYKDEGILDRTHLRFFTKKSLMRIINNNGFIIEKIEGINPYTGGSGLKRCLYYLAILLFGDDVRFMQFGTCLRYVGPFDKS